MTGDVFLVACMSTAHDLIAARSEAGWGLEGGRGQRRWATFVDGRDSVQSVLVPGKLFVKKHIARYQATFLQVVEPMMV